MKAKLRILLLEDNHADAELIGHELAAAGFDFQLERIESEAELHRAMEMAPPDLVLSDHGVPSFDGFKALDIVREKNPELPFIFVSGSNDQRMVARMYEEGAMDYVFKSDLNDLSPAVRKALQPPAQPVRGVELDQPLEVAIAFTRLRLCPSCLRAQDEGGTLVDFLDYFRNHCEIVVLHELCAACQPVSRLG